MTGVVAACWGMVAGQGKWLLFGQLITCALLEAVDTKNVQGYIFVTAGKSCWLLGVGR
jgi:hypothetical protein